MQRALVLAMLAVSCDGQSAVVVELHSDLEIPREANSLLARVQVEGRTVAEETYALGEPPRDRWPQTLPLIAGSTYDDRVMFAAEARIALSSGPSVIAGFGETEVVFPRSGSNTLRLELPRSCVDEDDDGFGIGFGCKRPDCDDGDPDVPSTVFCPGVGFPDAGPVEAGPDAGPIDSGPIDGGPIDGGPIDAGPDAGPNCEFDTCTADEACFNGNCYMRCTIDEDCGPQTSFCLPSFNVCICGAPCPNGDVDCGPYECINGCCNI